MDTKLSVSELLTKICSVELMTCSLAGDTVELHNVTVANVVSSTYKCVHCDEKFETYFQVSTHIKHTHLEDENGTVQLLTPVDMVEEVNELAHKSSDEGQESGTVEKPTHPEEVNGLAQKSSVQEQESGAVEKPTHPEEGNGTVQKLTNPEGEDGMVQIDTEKQGIQGSTGAHSKGASVAVVEDATRCETGKPGENPDITKSLVNIVNKETSIPETWTAVKSVMGDNSFKGDNSSNKKDDSCFEPSIMAVDPDINESTCSDDDTENNQFDNDTGVICGDAMESDSSALNPGIPPSQRSSNAAIADTRLNTMTEDTSQESRPRRRKCRPPQRYHLDEADEQPEDSEVAQSDILEEIDDQPRKRKVARKNLVVETNDQPKTWERPRRNLIDKSKDVKRRKLCPGYVGRRVVVNNKGKKLDKRRKAGQRRVTRTRIACPICSKILPHSSSLGAHMRFHKAEDTIQHCGICSLRMSSTQELENHAKTHPGYKPFKCSHSKCEASYPTHRSLRKHRQNHRPGVEVRFRKDDDPYKQCDICSQRFSKNADLEIHARTHPGYKPFKCSHSKCEASYTTDRCLRRHQENHRPGVEVRFRKDDDPHKQCDMCFLQFSSNADLENHAKTHPGYKPFKCSECGATYTLDRTLRRHRENHRKPPTEPKVYYCMECGLKYKNMTALKNHASVHPCYYPFRQRPYECGECGSSFEKSQDLDTHIEKHEGYKAFKCSLCGMDYSKKAEFDEHAKTHSFMALLYCFDCSKSFTSRSGLKKHLFIHNKPFQCGFCFKSFALEPGFKDHLRSHTDERPYLCSDCGKAFRSNSALNCHSKTHLVEKPFPCPLCEMKFAQKHKLTEHLRRHGGVRAYMCSICGLAFVTAGELGRHTKRHAKKDMKVNLRNETKNIVL